MIDIQNRVEESVSYIREHVDNTPLIGVVLGSGLGLFAESLENSTVLPTKEIPHYPTLSIEGHKGNIVFGNLDKAELLAFQGRVHFYESNSLEAVLYPIWVAHQLGIRKLIITNAAGGVNRTFRPGDLMAIVSHINLTLHSPSYVPLHSNSGRSPYSTELIETAVDIGRKLGIPLRMGVYAGVKGPSYETASEVEMIHRLGGDAVGMSTVFEASLACSLDMDVLGISCITNLGTGISDKKLHHDEVTEVGHQVRTKFTLLLSSVVRRIIKGENLSKSV